jgi:hypothetical protein
MGACVCVRADPRRASRHREGDTGPCDGCHCEGALSTARGGEGLADGTIHTLLAAGRPSPSRLVLFSLCI